MAKKDFYDDGLITDYPTPKTQRKTKNHQVKRLTGKQALINSIKVYSNSCLIIGIIVLFVLTPIIIFYYASAFNQTSSDNNYFLLYLYIIGQITCIILLIITISKSKSSSISNKKIVKPYIIKAFIGAFLACLIELLFFLAPLLTLILSR